MHDTRKNQIETRYSQNTDGQDWLAKSIRQSVADWKNILNQKPQPSKLPTEKWVEKSYREMKDSETPVTDNTVIPKDQPSSNPYVEAFSSGKFGTGTLEFMQFENQVQG